MFWAVIFSYFYGSLSSAEVPQGRIQDPGFLGFGGAGTPLS